MTTAAPQQTPTADEELLALVGDAAVEATPATEGTAPAKKQRRFVSTAIGLTIAPARCGSHLKSHLVDHAVEAQIRVLRQTRAAAEKAGDSAAAEEARVKIAELSKQIVRIAADTSIACAVMLDGAVEELLRHGMTNTVASDHHSSMDVADLHDGTPSQLHCWSLFHNLPSWVNFSKENEDVIRAKRAQQNKAQKEDRDRRRQEAKTAGVPLAKKGGKAAKAAAASDEPDAEHDTSTTFKNAVETALSTLKKEDAFKSVRVSTRLREYVSDLLIECLARVAKLSHIVVQDMAGVRTLNAGHIKSIIAMLMVDQGCAQESVDSVLAPINERLAAWTTYVKAEAEKKELNMTDAAKEAAAAKKAAAALESKKRQLQNCQKRIVETAKREAALAAELEEAAAAAELEKAVAEAAAV